MAIEAAVGQAGLVHDPVHPDALEPLLTEPPGRNLQDPLTIFGELLPADSHDTTPVSIWNFIYMTSVIYARAAVLSRNAWGEELRYRR
jgi:hypothetical protein